MSSSRKTGCPQDQRVVLRTALERQPSSSAALAPHQFDRLYVFGDSYSDIGEGYLDGNGPTAVAYLAKRLGLTLMPSNAANSSAQSLDFAVSGAQTGNGSGRKVENATLGYGMQNQVD